MGTINRGRFLSQGSSDRLSQAIAQVPVTAPSEKLPSRDRDGHARPGRLTTGLAARRAAAIFRGVLWRTARPLKRPGTIEPCIPNRNASELIAVQVNGQEAVA